MAIGIVSHQTASLTTGTSVTTPAFDTTGASLLVVGGLWVNSSDSTPGTPIQDLAGNTFAVVDNGGLVPRARLFYCESPITNASETVTMNATSSAIHTVFALAISGTALSSSLDQHNRNNDSASPFTSPSITTTQNDEILISLIIGDSGSNPATMVESTGFTIIDKQNNASVYWPGALAYRIVSSTGSYNASWTMSGASNTDVFIASFFASSAAPLVAWIKAS